MTPRWHALTDLWHRYAQVFRASWQMRHELSGPQRHAHELAFLPAHLELVETPVHPAPKWTARLIVLFAALTVLWAVLGRINVVTTAQGKLVPVGQVKVVQSMDTGTVRSILVRDGQQVRAGQALIDLDATQASADRDKAQAALIEAELNAARAQALLQAQDRAHAPTVAKVASAPLEDQSACEQLANAQYTALQEKLASQQAELLHRQDQLAATQAEVAKLTQTAPLAAEVAQSYASLVKDSYVARQDYLQKKQDSIDQQGQLAVQRSTAQALQAAIVQQQRDIAATSAQFRQDQLDLLNKSQDQEQQARQDLDKAQQRTSRLVLRAPVAGTVQQLAVYTVGGVVTQAKPLMEIVPDDTLEVEAKVSNKDIGFVQPGQTAAVKLETFSFTRYGYLHGAVRQVSNDAETTKKQTLVFPVRIHLDANRMWVDGHWVHLSPGMAVTVDIKTGRRSVADYFLSPLMKTAEESLHER